VSGRVAVVTDSAANLPLEGRSELGITVVPVLLERQGVLLRDEIDVTSPEFYAWMREHPEIATRTASPSAGDFLRVYEKLGDDHAGIVSVHVAAQLSATHAAALEAARLVGSVSVEVVDSRTASMGLGFGVLEAARAAARGAAADEVRVRAEEVAHRAKVYVVLDTLRYIHHSGRAPAIAGLMGAAIRVRPVLRVAEGRVRPCAVQRTLGAGVRRLAALVEREAEGKAVHLAILHGDAASRAAELQHLIEERVACVEVHTVQFTPVMGAATGPGLVGVAFYAERE
jgi:DegV family protein with EDD domain